MTSTTSRPAAAAAAAARPQPPARSPKRPGPPPRAWAQPMDPDAAPAGPSASCYSVLRDLGIAARGLAAWQLPGQAGRAGARGVRPARERGRLPVPRGTFPTGRGAGVRWSRSDPAIAIPTRRRTRTRSEAGTTAKKVVFTASPSPFPLSSDPSRALRRTGPGLGSIAASGGSVCDCRRSVAPFIQPPERRRRIAWPRGRRSSGRLKRGDNGDLARQCKAEDGGGSR